MIVRKLESSGGDGVTRPQTDDSVTIGYLISEYAPQQHGKDCRGRQLRRACIEAQLSMLELPCLPVALLSAAGGMTINEKATFIVTVEPDDEQTTIANCFILELHLRAINHTITYYNVDAYAYLPHFEEAVEGMRSQEWPKMERAFGDVKAVFAEYNKWDDYGIALPYKDFDLRNDERLIEFNGTSIPWYGAMTDTLERHITPRCLRSWEGKTVAYSFYMRRGSKDLPWDVSFEQEALQRLGGLALVRLEQCEKDRGKTLLLAVEGVQSGVVVSYPPEACNALLQQETMIPIMWKFQRYREGASDRYKMIATRFRRPVEYTSSSKGWMTPESERDSMVQPDALFTYVASQIRPETHTSQLR